MNNPCIHVEAEPPCDHAKPQPSCPWCIVERQGEELRELRARIAKVHDAMVSGVEAALVLVRGLR